MKISFTCIYIYIYICKCLSDPEQMIFVNKSVLMKMKCVTMFCTLLMLPSSGREAASSGTFLAGYCNKNLNNIDS